MVIKILLIVFHQNQRNGLSGFMQLHLSTCMPYSMVCMQLRNKDHGCVLLQKFHTAPVSYPTIHHFVTKWCIVGICLMHCRICEIGLGVGIVLPAATLKHWVNVNIISIPGIIWQPFDTFSAYSILLHVYFCQYRNNNDYIVCKLIEQQHQLRATLASILNFKPFWNKKYFWKYFHGLSDIRKAIFINSYCKIIMEGFLCFFGFFFGVSPIVWWLFANLLMLIIT